jgi:predicted permease
MWRWFKGHAKDEQDLNDEIQFHLAEETRLRIEAGGDPDEASASARRAFGNVTLVREVTRDAWGHRAFETVAQDARHGVRLLARHRLFAAFSIVSLALGIGGTSAVFSLYDAIVLRQLPVEAADRLVTLGIHGGGKSNSFMPYPQFDAMQRGSQSLEGMFARTTLPNLSIRVQGTAAIASGLAVAGDYHGTLGVNPAIGRLLTSDDDRPGQAAVAVISYAYWQRRFGATPSILGEAITLNKTPFPVVGVEPPGFFGVTVGSAPDVTIPMHALGPLFGREPPWSQAFGTWIEVMARLRHGVSTEQATTELDGIFRQVSLDAAGASGTQSSDGQFARETHVVLASGATGGVSGLREDYEQGLRVLLMLLGGVLCLASLNVAALLLSRSEARRDEFATRLALGAGRGRIVRQLLTESAVIAACGGVLGLLIAWRGSELLLRVATSNTDMLPIDLAPDARVVTFTCAVSIASCLMFGLLPAARTTAASRISSRGELGGRGRRLLDRGLVVSQTAVALVLVVCTGLFLRSLQNLWAQDTGYDRHNVQMFSIDSRLIGKRGPEALQVYRRVLDELRAIPAARAVTVSTVRPVSDSYYLIDRVTRIGDRALTSDDAVRIAFNHLGPDYFGTMGIPLVAGRDFDWRDAPDAPKVAIISEQLARRFSGNPVGQRMTFGEDDVLEVVGVAGDTRYARVKDAPRAVVYLPFFQQMPGFPPTYEIKYVGTSADLLRSAGEAMARIDPALAPFRAKTLEVQTRESFARERLLAWLTTYCGAFAWLLAGIGLYGLMACTVAQRTREFGLRMALGAQPAGIRWTVMRESAATVVTGLVGGLAAAVMAVRLVRTQLFGVEPADPTTLAGAVLALLVLACCASFIPARRASRIDPMTALRQE